MKARTGLTRLDILVLLALILFLAGNIPVIMAGGRGNAKRQVCMANLGQLASAWDMFTEDNAGKIPSGDVGYSWVFPNPPGPQLAWVEYPHHYPHSMPPTANTNGISGPGAYSYNDIANLTEEIWHHTISEGLLWNYIKDYRVYKCPNGNKNNQVTYSMSMSMNTYPNAGGTNCPTLISKSKLTNPAERFVFLDTGVMKGGAFFVAYSGTYMGKWGDLPPIRHEMGTMFSFADGHTIYRKWTDPHTIVSTGGSWGGGSVDYCDCDLRWITKVTWGKVLYDCTDTDKHCEY